MSSIVSTNVGETLRIYANEKERDLRIRLKEYRERKQAEFEEHASNLITQFELNEWFLTHREEVQEWLNCLHVVSRRVRDRAQRDMNDFEAIPVVTEKSNKSNFGKPSPQIKESVDRLFMNGVRDVRFKLESSILQKHEDMKAAIRYIRESMLRIFENEDGAGISTPSAVSPESSTIYRLEILKAKLEGVLTQAVDSQTSIQCQINASLSELWKSEIRHFASSVGSTLEKVYVQSKAMSDTPPPDCMQRRRLIMIEKRICDIRVADRVKRAEAIQETLNLYRSELCRLFSKYLILLSEKLKPGGGKVISTSSTVAVEAPDLEAIWGRRKNITQEYKVKFIQNFIERVQEPELYENLANVFALHDTLEP